MKIIRAIDESLTKHSLYCIDDVFIDEYESNSLALETYYGGNYKRIDIKINTFVNKIELTRSFESMSLRYKTVVSLDDQLQRVIKVHHQGFKGSKESRVVEPF